MIRYLWIKDNASKDKRLKPPWFLSNLLPSNWVTSTGLVFTNDRCLIWVQSRAFWEIFSNTTTIGWTPPDFGPFLYLLIRIKSNQMKEIVTENRFIIPYLQIEANDPLNEIPHSFLSSFIIVCSKKFLLISSEWLDLSILSSSIPWRKIREWIIQ